MGEKISQAVTHTDLCIVGLMTTEALETVGTYYRVHVLNCYHLVYYERYTKLE